jgi:uncharacterized protein YhaN
VKIRSLELEQFRKFDRPVRLCGFTDSLNIICGPNEFGKSTILAAIRGLLFERHTSKAEPVKRMQSWRGNAAPRLAMDFEVGGGRWRIEKRFLHQPMANLTAPDGGRFDGDAAEEELQRLLGFGAAGKRGSGPDQMGVWGALWVTQRESVLQADLSSNLARATVTSCLDAEVGVLTGSEKGQALMRIVRDQLGQLLDGNSRPRGRYRQVMTAIGDGDAKLAELRDRAKRLSEDSDALRDRAGKLARESDVAAERRDQAALDDARRRKEAALVRQQRLDAATSAHALAERNWEDAEHERLARATRAEATLRNADVLAQAVETAKLARQSVEVAEAQFAQLRTAVDAAQTRATTSAQATRRMREAVEVVRRAATFAACEAAVEQAASVQIRVNGLVARLDAMRINKDSIAVVRNAAREHERAHSVLEAQATQIEFDLLPDAVGQVELDGATVPLSRKSISVVEATELTIAGIGRISVRPAIRDKNKLLKSLETAKDHLRAALADADCDDLSEAERHWAEQEILERDLGTARAELARLVPGDPKVGLAAGIGPLRAHVDVLRLRLREEWAALGMDVLPTAAQAAADARAAEDEDIAGAEALAQARAELDASNERRGEARQALARADGAAEAAEAERVRLCAEADRAAAREPDDALAARLADAETKRAHCSAALTELQRDRPLDTPEGMQARIERYERSLTTRQQIVRQLREEIAALRARITQEGGHGLDEQIAAAERERAALAQEQDHCLRETRVLTLLLETLSAAERETKERYLAPVIRRVTPYLRSLFPGADITCDDTLRITGLTRAHLGTEEFDRLSDGTQEQLAVLARLGFAEMLIDQGKPAMAILDDALAYSDDERIERMFDILTQASAKTQILILSCREGLFARLGGSRIELTQASSVPST